MTKAAYKTTNSNRKSTHKCVYVSQHRGYHPQWTSYRTTHGTLLWQIFTQQLSFYKGLYLTPCLGDTTLSTGFRENSHAHRMVVKPYNKVGLKRSLRIFPSFLPSLNYLAAFHRQKSREVKCGKKKNKGLRYLNPKSTTIEQHRRRRPTKQIISIKPSCDPYSQWTIYLHLYSVLIWFCKSGRQRI